MINEIMGVWGTIGSVALAILILLVMITIHEFGHYLAGKLLKFKIDEFSVGFGPALFKLKRKKSEEIFAVRLIPLGGYCAFHGEDGLEEETPAPLPPSGGGAEEIPAPDGLPGQSPADTEQSLGLPGRTLGHPEQSLGHPEQTLGHPEQTLGHPEQTLGHPELAEGSPQTKSAGETPASPPPNAPEPPTGRRRDWKDDGEFTHMKPWKRIIVLVAGATMNYLLALLFILICFSAYGQSLVRIDSVRADEAWESGLSFRDGDILIGAEGRNFYLTNDIARAVNNKKEGDLVEFLVSRVQEDGTRREETVKIALRCEVKVKNSTDFKSVWKALGVGDDEINYLLSTTVCRFGFFETVGRSLVYSFRLAGSIFRVLGELLTGKLGLEAFGGPVTTIRMTSQIASQGVRDFLEISALIGVNLAVFNLLPIPALDGSKVVFTAIEWVRGRPISRKIEAIIHGVGFLLLIGFAILVDVLQFV